MNKIKNRRRGFLQLIIIIIIAIALMAWFDVSITEVLDYARNFIIEAINWFKGIFNSVR